ncbi:MAG: glycosyl hydrolase [Thermoanaerobaculia bacterium]|nr:glycosyl hydrolase [Thermoanaerobaculia bacterium]
MTDRSPWIPVVVACIGMLVFAGGLEGARAGNSAEATYPDEAFRALEYRLVGPWRGGRVTAVAGHPTDLRTFYMGSTGGGVWKTTDGGITWKNVSDKVRRVDPEEEPVPMGEGPPAAGTGEEERRSSRKERGRAPKTEIRDGDGFGSASVGAVAVAPSDPNVVYVGTGSACIRGNVSAGDGVYKSSDGGESWHHVGLEEAGQIGRIQVHPKDPDRVWVAALGHAFGPNPTRGVFRSTDGGKTWERILFVSEEAGAVDLALDPSNPRILYAATWEAVRKPWTMISGGEGSGLYKSTDGGDTWRELTEGLPEGIKGKIGVAVSPANPDRVWTLVEHEEKWGLYRSDDGGESFRRVSDDRNLVQRAWYYTHVYADPKDANTVYVLNVAMWRSDDGGKSFTPVRTPHGDNHDLWIHPEHPNVMVQGNDGGANVSYDGGRTWSAQDNQPTAEMYRVTVDDQHPYWLYGGQQDNSAVAIPSRAPGSGIARQDWYTPGGCESAYVAVDPRDPDITYAGCYGGTIGRYDRELHQEQQVMPYPEMAVGQRAADLKYRFQWNAPIEISPHDPSVLYHTSNHVHRSTDEGQSWEVISPDLTRDDESKQGYAGGPITWDNTGVEVFGTIFAFEEDPREAGVLWAGSVDGLVHLSRVGGASWEEITPAQMPEWGTVNDLELSPHAPGRAFIPVHRYRMDDFRPYVFRTNDWGQSWELLTDGTNGIPEDHFVRAVVEDPERKGLLYAGTEFGMYVSFDDGERWQPLQLDLPVTPITDLEVQRGDLVVATQGRSYWILDDLTPIRELTPEVLSSEAHLFPVRPALQWVGTGGWGFGGNVGENPPYGAVIHYFLAEELSGEDDPEVTLELLDSEGEVLRTLSSKTPEPSAPNPWAEIFPGLAEPKTLSAEEGLNRYVWNLRLPDAFVVPDATLWGSPEGPEVPPGTYSARLAVGDWSDSRTIEVRSDPRRDLDPAQLQERFELARTIWESISEAHRALARSRDVREQIDATVVRLEDAGKVDEATREQAKELTEELKSLEDRLHQSEAESGQDILNFPPQIDNQLVFLQGVVETARTRPTEGSHQRWEDLRSELDSMLAELEGIYEGPLEEFNAAVAALDTPPVMIKQEVGYETAGE